MAMLWQDQPVQKEREKLSVGEVVLRIVSIVAMAAAILAIVFWSAKVSAQTRDPFVASACEISTEGLTKAAKQIVKLRCELEQAELKRQIREAKNQTPKESDAIGVAVSNQAVTTVTYRDNTGKALEASKGWAQHEEKMAKIAKPDNPCGGFWGWWNCPSVPGYGYGYGAGAGGYNTIYSAGGDYGTGNLPADSRLAICRNNNSC